MCGPLLNKTCRCKAKHAARTEGRGTKGTETYNDALRNAIANVVVNVADPARVDISGHVATRIYGDPPMRHCNPAH